MEGSLKSDYNNFQSEVSRRKISRLIHFTSISNLRSILEIKTILSRNKLKALSLEKPEMYINDYVQINDELRLDKLEDYINLSIEYPNHFLMKRFIDKCDEYQCGGWCIIAIDPWYIWHKNTLFSISNAAGRYSQTTGIKGTFEAFTSLFMSEIAIINSQGTRSHNRKHRPDSCPTDIQAEVLVLDSIPSTDIKCVYFQSEEDKRLFETTIRFVCSEKQDIPLLVDNTIFKAQ